MRSQNGYEKTKVVDIMFKRKKNTLQSYLTKIHTQYDIILTEQNYQDIILEELDSPPALLNYFKDYMEKNKEIITLEWGCLMFLFIRVNGEQFVPDIEKYYNRLKQYPPNYFTELMTGELELRYYGNVFKAKDKFLLALELKPNDAHSNYNLGFVYSLLGVFDKSKQYYEDVIINCQTSPTPKEIKARSLYNIAVYKINIDENYKEAKRLLQEALNEMPNYPQARNVLSQIDRISRGPFKWIR